MYCTGYSKHEFACILIAAFLNDTGSVYEYELPWNASSFFVYTVVPYFRHENSKNTPEIFDVNNYIIIMAHVTST